MLKINYTFLLLLTAFLLIPAENKINFDHLTVNDGLSQGSVYTIIQDSRGFMWFGTKDGLNRYDGNNFVIYRHIPGNDMSLSNNRIYTIIEDKKGFLWIGTSGGGLCKFDPKKNIFKTFRYNKNEPSTISNDVVTSIFEDNTGILWIGTGGNGINKFDPITEKFKHIKEIKTNNININYIMKIKNSNIFGENHLWVGTRNGLFLFNKKKENFKYHNLDGITNFNSSKQMFITDFIEINNYLWITSMGGGIIRYNLLTKKIIQSHPSQNQPKIDSYEGFTAICNNKDKSIWLATINAGIRLFDKISGKFKTITNKKNNPKSLLSNEILSIYKSRSGIIWIGTNGHGLSYYYKDSVNFSIITKGKNKLEFLSTRTINEDKNGNLWIAGYGGVNQFNKDKTLKSSILKGESIYSLLHDPDIPNIIWAGSEGGGLYKYNKKNNLTKTIAYTFIKDENKILGYSIYSIIHDTEDILWLGTELGLNKFDKRNNQVIHYTHNSKTKNSISHGRVKTIYKDSHNNLWIGTDIGGISKLNKESNTFTNYIHDPDKNSSISNNTILSFYEDRNKNLWIGTAGGLNKFDKKTKNFSVYTGKDGLPNDTVYGILEDEKGDLWLSSNNGLSKFNPKTESFKNYDFSYGLQSNEFNTASYFKSKDNTLYFGGVNGVTYFNPDDIKKNPYKPPIVLTSFKIFNKDVILKEDIIFAKVIKINYKDTMFSFEFAALNFYNSHRNRYAYKIKELHKEWIDIENRRVISIANLNPGNYTLQIKGSNNNNIWSTKNISIKLIITPPFWKTWWFRIIIVFIFLSTIGFIIFLRITLLQKRNIFLNDSIRERTKELEQAKNEAEKANKVKSDFLANVSHEIRTPLNAVLGYSEILKESIKDKERSGYINSIISSGSSLLYLINDILDISKIEADKIEIKYKTMNFKPLLDNIKSIFSLKTKKKGLKFTFELDKDIPSEIIFDELRLRQIFLNLIGNAVKFTESGFVDVSVKKISKESTNKLDLEILIDDSGIGIPINEQGSVFNPFIQQEGQDNKYGGTGLGLSITKKLIELMNGTISIKEKLSKGTMFSVIFKNIKIVSIEKKKNISEESTKKTNKYIYISAKKIDELNSILKTLKIKWRKTQARFIIDEIERFGAETFKIGVNYKLKPLLAWSVLIKNQVKNMEIEELSNTMNDFDSIISDIENNIKE